MADGTSRASPSGRRYRSKARPSITTAASPSSTSSTGFSPYRCRTDTIFGVHLGPTSPITTRLSAVAAALTVATAIGVAIDADVATASLMLLVAVVAASLLGLAPGLLSAVVAAAILNVRFTPPVGSFRVETADDVVAIGTFLVVAVTVGTVVARFSELRRDAQRRAGEASLRLD